MKGAQRAAHGIVVVGGEQHARAIANQGRHGCGCTLAILGDGGEKVPAQKIHFVDAAISQWSFITQARTRPGGEERGLGNPLRVVGGKRCAEHGFRNALESERRCLRTRNRARAPSRKVRGVGGGAVETLTHGGGVGVAGTGICRRKWRKRRKHAIDVCQHGLELVERGAESVGRGAQRRLTNHLGRLDGDERGFLGKGSTNRVGGEARASERLFSRGEINGRLVGACVAGNAFFVRLRGEDGHAQREHALGFTQHRIVSARRRAFCEAQ